MAHAKEISTSGGGGGGSIAPASNAGSAAPSRGNSSASGNYSRSGSPSASSKTGPKPSARSSGGGSRDSSAHAAASADRTAAAGRGKVATFTPTRKSSTPWALDWADEGYAEAKNGSQGTRASFGSKIDNKRRLTGQFDQQGKESKTGVYAGGGLNPSAWGSSFLSPSRKSDSSKLQDAIDNLKLPTDYKDRNIHALDPAKGDKSYREKVDNWNYDRSVWAYNDTLGAFTREYESPEAQLTDMLDLMAHAQVYYKDSLDQDRKYTIDGKEVSAADAWKGLYDDLERYTSRLTDWGQIQDLYTKIQNGEEVTTMNVDALTARAQAQIGKATDDEDAAFWQDVVNNLGTLRIGVNRAQYDKLSDAVAQRQAEFDAATEKIEDLYRSGGAGMLEDGSALETAGAERAAAKKALKEAKDALEAWAPNTNEERDALIAKMHEKASLLKGGLTAEEQQRLLELDAELYNPQIDYGKDFVRRGALVGGMFEKAAGHVNKGVTSAANWLLGDLFDEFTALANTTASGLGIKKEIPNVVKGIDKFVEDTVAADEAYYGQNIAGSSVAKVVDQYGTMTAESLPMVVVAHLTGGASLTSEGLASMAAAEQGGTLARIAEGATQLIKSQAADPNFQFTFVQTFGQGYENALADGASTDEASVYALLNAYVNTSIELGGGIQSLPKALASGDEGALKAYAKSILEEISEEWRQNPAEVALKSLYKPVEMYSTEDGEAVINPRRGIESAKGAGFVAAVLGAPSTAVNIARNGVSGALGVDKDGRIVPALDGTAVRRGANRHDTAVTTLADRTKAAGYVNPANPDEAYTAATTGAQGPRTDAEADQQSYAQEIEAEAERQAEAEEARKAEETKEANRKENTELEEQARIREQETEGAKRAAQAFQDEQNAQLKAAQEAEKYAQLAHNAREFEAEQDFLRQAQQAKQAAEEAGRKAEEQLAIANSQSQAIEAQDTNPAPAPANQEEANQEIADVQAATLAGQDSSPVEAPQNIDLATASETAPEAQAASAQANTQAEGVEAVKPTANEQGEGPASIATAEEGRAAIERGETNNKTVAEVIPMVDKHVSESEPISTVAQNVFESRGSGKTPLSDRVANWIKSRFPTGVHSKAINGNVIVDKRGIKNDIAHGVGEAKAATFAAVPDVLDKGTIVSRSDGSVKNRSVTIAGKVMLNGSPVNVYCVVKQNSGDNRFYLHEVSDGNGTVFYKLGQNNNATPALLDSTGTNPASADVASTASIAQNPQADNNTNSSTNVQADGTINDKDIKEGVPHEGIEDLYEDFVEDPSDGQLDGEPGVSGRSGDNNREALADTGAEASAQLERDGARRVKEENWTPGVKKLIQRFKTDGLSAATLHDRTNYKGTFAKGFSLKTAPNDGIFGSYNAKLNTGERSRGRKPEGLGQLLAHEYAHNTFTRKNFEQCKEVIEAAYDSIGLSGENRDDIRDRLIWARGYKEYSSGYSRADWQKLSREERLNIIEALPDSTKKEVYERLFNELASDVVGNRENFAFGDYFSFLREAALAEFVERKIFSPRFAIGLDADIEAADAESDSKVVTEEPETNINQNSFIETVSENLEDVAEIEQTQQTSVGRTPGRVKQSQSAFEQDVATKGERANTDTAMGEAEFLSRTNEARSRTADALTDTQEKADAQAQRLLQEDYVWNDDDVVIAQKLMLDMLKGIRDYQMNKTSRMKPDAFRKMTEQYNKLMTKHQQRLSESGQTLQANYMFSTGDKIVMKAAQTFLGFTKDGRFAGGSVNAKNATIYAGIEEASKRIQAAVDAKDVQSLAKICKDISDIRNVKKMFGPLGKFASEMENRVLNRIAKGENAAENLENLAYGNLNAVCDDVQPYKALNAAKTIRVMNMLSNTATIVNNLANNFAQGAVSKSMVNQALSSLASKPFEALTGQQVISKAQRGKEANRAVRNAQAEALETATLMQMYGITEENGRLELNDRGMFNPNINAFEQTMSLYKFLTGMGVEATDKMQAAGILKSMELGIDADIKAGKIEPHTKEQRMQEARHEVNRLLYKDDNSTTALVQHIRDFLNKFHVGNDRVGTIGLGDITMAFAKIPANIVRARLAMTPEGALLQVAQYAKGVNKAKRMHAEVLAKGIVDSYREQIDAANTALQSAYEMEWGPAKDAAIRKAQSELSRLNSKMWAEAQDACRGSVYRNLRTISQNYNENMMFDEAVERAGYMNAKEMSQFEAAQLSRKIGRAATSAGMMALGSVLRALGALRDFDQEPDDELRKMNSDKGYRGLMMNLSAIGRKNHEWKDGDLIIDGEFLEVIAMPLTIGATAAEAAATAQDAKTWSWLKSMAGNGIAKTFEAVGDIPGMADAINMYESLTSAYNTDYDEKVNRLGAGLIQYAANTIPSFFMPNAVSQATAGFDNKVRDVYAADTPWGQAKNIFMNKIPVLRNKVPVSVDVWGNERTYGEGPWGAINKMLLPGDVHVYRQNKYEAEIERLVREGYGNATPKTTVNSSFEVGDEKYTMTAQEKLDFKAARNSEQKELFEAFMDSKYYEQLNDAERMKVLQSLKTSAERDAKQDMLDSRQLNVQITRDRWETELLDVNDQIQFLTAKQLANNVLDRDAEDMDYAAVDKFLTGTYRGLSTTQRDLLDSSFSKLDDMYEAKSHYGISSETFNKGYDIYKDYMSQEGKDRVKGGYKDWEGSQMYTDIAKATGASEKQMDFFEDKFVLYNNNAVVPEKYNTLVDAGWGRESAQALVKNVADLTPTNGRKNVSYKQRLTAIATTSGLTEAQRWEAFYEYCPSSYTSVLKKMGKYRSNGFSLAKALKAAGKWDP